MTRLRKTPIAVAIIAAASAAAIPHHASAAAYYFASFQLTDGNIRGEYFADANEDGVYNEADGDFKTLARPGSRGDGSDSDGSPADPNKNATNAGNTTALAVGDGVFFGNSETNNTADHIPPASYFTDIGSAASPTAVYSDIFTGGGPGDPGNNGDWDALGETGEYVRADQQSGGGIAVQNAFTGAEASGTFFNTVVEGRVTTPYEPVRSEAESSISAWLDFGDLGLDDPSGNIADDGTTAGGTPNNLGWTGNVQVDFDYITQAALSVDNIDEFLVGDFAEVGYALTLDLFQEGGSLTNPIWSYTDSLCSDGNDPACDADGDGVGDNINDILPEELKIEGSIVGNGVESISSQGRYQAYFDLSALANDELASNFFWKVGFQIETAGEIEAVRPVPEPVSLVLMGTGLAGIGAATWRRRRRTAA